MQLLTALTALAIALSSVQAVPFMLPANAPNIPWSELLKAANLPDISDRFPTPPTTTIHPVEKVVKHLGCIGKCAKGCLSVDQLQQCVLNCHAYCQFFA